jgi:hypothetical protein
MGDRTANQGEPWEELGQQVPLGTPEEDLSEGDWMAALGKATPGFQPEGEESRIHFDLMPPHNREYDPMSSVDDPARGRPTFGGDRNPEDDYPAPPPVPKTPRTDQPKTGGSKGREGGEKPLLAPRERAKFEAEFSGLQRSPFGTFVKPSNRDPLGRSRHGNTDYSQKISIREKTGVSREQDPLAYAAAENAGKLLQLEQANMHPLQKERIRQQLSGERLQLLMQMKQERKQDELQDQEMTKEFHKMATSFLKHEDPTSGQRLSPAIAFRLAAKMMPTWFRERMSQGDDVEVYAHDFDAVGGMTQAEGRQDRQRNFQNEMARYSTMRRAFENDRQYRELVRQYNEKRSDRGEANTEAEKQQAYMNMLNAVQGYRGVFNSMGKKAADNWARTMGKKMGVDLSSLTNSEVPEALLPSQGGGSSAGAARVERTAAMRHQLQGRVQGDVESFNNILQNTKATDPQGLALDMASNAQHFLRNVDGMARGMKARGMAKISGSMIDEFKEIRDPAIRAASFAVVGSHSQYQGSFNDKELMAMSPIGKLMLHRRLTQRFELARAQAAIAKSSGRYQEAKTLEADSKKWENSADAVRFVTPGALRGADPDELIDKMMLKYREAQQMPTGEGT